MMATAQLIAQAPMLFVSDLDRSVEYWSKNVGFDVVGLYGEPRDFAILNRDAVHVMLCLAPEGHEIVPFWKVRSNIWNGYFWVDDAASLYAELIERGAVIDYELCEQPYGVLEFGIRDLDDQDIGFGQVLNPQASNA